MLEEFAARCPRLEIIRWNYNCDGDSLDADGHELQALNNRKELYSDHSNLDFVVDRPIDENGDVVDEDDDNNDNK